MKVTHGFTGTAKQREIVALVLAGADEGAPLRSVELKARLSYGPTVSKEAIRCSLRFLEKHGLVQRKPGRGRNEILPTLKAYQMFRRMPVSGEP